VHPKGSRLRCDSTGSDMAAASTDTWWCGRTPSGSEDEDEDDSDGDDRGEDDKCARGGGGDVAGADSHIRKGASMSSTGSSSTDANIDADPAAAADGGGGDDVTKWRAHVRGAIPASQMCEDGDLVVPMPTTSSGSSRSSGGSGGSGGGTGTSSSSSSTSTANARLLADPGTGFSDDAAYLVEKCGVCVMPGLVW
jgi:hypothetical protein